MKSLLYHIAEVNIARMIAPLDDPVMSGFVSRLDEINALADQSPGFVWRFQGNEGNAAYLRPYDDDRIIINLSVWESIEDLKQYVYRSAHGQAMSQRRQWFEKFEGMYMALWWVKAGHQPSIAEAKQRLEHLQHQGATAYAFTFKETFKASEDREEDFMPPALNPCQA